MTPFSGDARTVRRAQLFPNVAKPFYEIFRIADSQEKRFYLLSRRPELYWVHPVPMGTDNRIRTQPCTGEGQDCWLSHGEVASIIQGWVWVKSYHTGKTGLVTLTEMSLAKCPALLDQKADLRGRELILRRKLDKACSEMIARLSDNKALPQLIGETPSLVDLLVKLWGAPPRPVQPKQMPKSIQELYAKWEAERRKP